MRVLHRKTKRYSGKGTNFKRILGILLVFVVIILSFFFKQFRESLFINSISRVNLLLKTSPLVLLSIPKVLEEQVVVITIPQDVSVEVPFGYGKYRLEAAERLGVLEKNPQLLSETVEDLLGTRIQADIEATEGKELDLNRASVLKKVKQEFSFSHLLKARKTGLSFSDQLILASKMVEVRADSIVYYELHTNKYIFTDSHEADGSIVKQVKQSALDEFLEQRFQDNEVRNQSLSLEVKNTTREAFVAQKFARFLNNLGGKVISVSNDDRRETDNCEIEFNESSKDAKIIRILIQEFGCAMYTYTDTNRVDVTVYVGEVYGKRWTRKD